MLLKFKKNEAEDMKNASLESARQLFLTLSQTELTVPEVYDKLLLEDKLEHLAVVLETHTKDMSKGKHIHVYLSYQKKRHLSLRHFDFLQKGVHVEKVRHVDNLLAYMNKENECKANFDIWRPLLAAKSKFAKTLATMVSLGYDLDEIQAIYTGELADKPWSTVTRFLEEANMAKAKPAKGLAQQLRWITRELIEIRLTPEELAIFDSDPQFQTLVDYINKVKKFGSRQIHKECCLSIVSGPSTGKSSLLLMLAKHYNNYNFPNDGWHRESYDNDVYSMWTWNEWDISALPWNDLLLLFEGFDTDLRIKGAKTLKFDRPMLFLASNESYVAHYTRRFDYLRKKLPYSFKVRQEALDVRIKEVNFGKQNLFFLQKLFVGVNDDIKK